MLNIFIDNLATTTTEQTLREKFEPFGHVLTVQLVRDRDTGAARGFAFIEMSSDAEAKVAIDAVNGTMIDGQTVSVNEARAKVDEFSSIEKQMRLHREHRY